MESHCSDDFDLATRVSLMPCSCRDSYSGSLFPLPPERRRREEFCGSCAASSCLFGGTPATRRMRRGHRRGRGRAWAPPDDLGLDVYIAALRLYTHLLRLGQVCWRCANLYRLAGARHNKLRLADKCYVCPFIEGDRSQESGDRRSATPGFSLVAPYVMGAWQAQLCTSLEGCDREFFRQRDGAIPRITPAEWRCLALRGRQQGRCASCAHLRRLVVAGRERFTCSLEVEGRQDVLLWRVARSWRVLEDRRREESWCRGQRWQLRLHDFETDMRCVTSDPQCVMSDA